MTTLLTTAASKAHWRVFTRNQDFGTRLSNDPSLVGFGVVIFVGKSRQTVPRVWSWLLSYQPERLSNTPAYIVFLRKTPPPRKLSRNPNLFAFINERFIRDILCAPHASSFLLRSNMDGHSAQVYMVRRSAICGTKSNTSPNLLEIQTQVLPTTSNLRDSSLFDFSLMK